MVLHGFEFTCFDSLPRPKTKLLGKESDKEECDQGRRRVAKSIEKIRLPIKIEYIYDGVGQKAGKNAAYRTAVKGHCHDKSGIHKERDP
jgi:hypothetical protein